MDNPTERARGILSKSDRAYIRDPDSYNRQASYERRKHIRERTWNAFVDGALLCELDPDERSRIFDGWDEFADSIALSERGDGIAFPTVEQMKGELGFSAWIAFLYAGINAGDKFDFRTTLERGIKYAEASRGRVVTDFDFEVQTRARRDIDELTQRFEHGAELTTREIQRLRNEADISDEALGDYYDRRGSAAPSGLDLTSFDPQNPLPLDTDE